MSTAAEYKFAPSMYSIGDTMTMQQMPMVDDPSTISECNGLDSSGDLQTTTEENVSSRGGTGDGSDRVRLSQTAARHNAKLDLVFHKLLVKTIRKLCVILKTTPP